MPQAIPYAVGQAALFFTGSFAVASALATATPYILLAAASYGYSHAQQQRKLNSLEGALGNGSLVNDDRGLQQVVFEANPAMRLPLGTAIQSGIPFFAAGSKGTRPYLTYGLNLSEVPCGPLRAVWMGNRRVKLDAQGLAIEFPFFDGNIHFVEVAYQPGTRDQAINPILRRDFPDLPDSFRLPLMANAVIKAHYGSGADIEEKQDAHKDLFGDGFQPVFEFDGALTYDPRKADHDLSDVFTWETTSNASLNIMRYMQWKFPHLRIDWDLVALAADIDDEWEFDADGNAYRRHTADGVISDADDAFTVVNDLLTSNGGMLIKNSGAYYPLPAQRKEPVGTLHAGMLRGGYQIDYGVPFSDLVEQVIPEFFSVERDRSFVTGPAIGQTGSDKRRRTLRLGFTRDVRRAQRLATRVYKRAQGQKTMSASVDMRARKWTPGQVIRVHFEGTHSRANGLYEITSKQVEELTKGYVLSLQQYDIADELFNPATEYQPFELAA